MSELYYTAPSDEIFNEVKKEAMAIWNTYDDPYRTDKVNRIKDIENISDNLMYMVAMFDHINQQKLASNLSAEAKEAIFDRLGSGGAATFELQKWM